MTEHLKIDPEDFGGFQTERLSRDEARQRYCVKRFCAQPGFAQIMVKTVSPQVYQVVCERHFVMLVIIQAAVLGDPSPLSEGRRVADEYGISFENIPEINTPQIVDVKTAICGRCGGGFFSETVGMYAGLRWIHTCQTEEEKRAGND